MIQKLEKEGVTHFSERHVEVQNPDALMEALHNSSNESSQRP